MFQNTLKCQVQRTHDTGPHANTKPENNISNYGFVSHEFSIGQCYQWHLHHLEEEQVESQFLEDNIHGQFVNDGTQEEGH